MMEKALAIQKEVERILGTEVYLVGGSVRDIVMGNIPKDYDFTTPMLPDDIESKVKATGRKAYTIGKQFGTIGFKVKLRNNSITNPEPKFEGAGSLDEILRSSFDEFVYEYVEVTTFRSEVYTSKSRKPEVQFVPSLDEDLARRDFTMNAMVLKSDGKIYDPFGGKLDIHAKQLKTVGLPKDRVQEDPLRILRAARFAARYNFTIDPNFIGKARQLADRIYGVSVERWVQEMDKLLTSTYVSSGIKALGDMGMIERILPEFWTDDPSGLLVDFMSYDSKVYASPDMAWHDLLRCVNDNPKIARYIAGGICHRLKFSNDRAKIVLDKLKP